MSKESESCPGCGKMHGFPFSNEMIQAYKEYKSADSEEERAALCFKVAGIFAFEFDLTDPEWNESFHDLVEKFKDSENKFDRMSRKLARIVIGFMDTLKIDEHVNTQEEIQEDKPN